MRFIQRARASALVALVTVSVLAGAQPASAQVSPGPDVRPPQPPAAAPPALLRFDQPAVFTVALGSESATNAKIAVALATRLRQNGEQNLGPVRHAWIVPEGTWTIADYLQQCAKDPQHTLGAFIVLPPSSANSQENYIALLRSSTSVTLSVMIAECRQTADAPGDTSVVWVSRTTPGEAGRTQVEFFPLAVLTSVYLAFAPQRTFQTTTVTAFPTPNPIPASGTRSQVQTVNGSVLNAQGSAAVQANVLNAFAGNSGALGVTIGASASPDKQTLRAADDAIGHLVTEQVDGTCTTRRQASAFPGIAPPPRDPFAFCGW